MPGAVPGMQVLGAPTQPPGFNQGDSLGPDAGHWQPTASQKQHYDKLFNQADAGGLGKLQGIIAFKFLSRSKLAKELLREVQSKSLEMALQYVFTAILS